jgi:hypothetical protein
MIIKLADDKQTDIQTLQNLLVHPQADANTKKRIEQEIRNIRAGLRGEEEAAYEMKVHWGDSKNWMIIHDLRVEHNGLIAQIDHLLINRVLEFWVCESKHFSEGISINQQGEFTAFFAGKAYGVPSPIEQNNKHILILNRIFEAGGVRLPKRLGLTMSPKLKGLVLVSKNARINRPKEQINGLNTIIKNDQLFSEIQKSHDNNDAAFLQLARVIGSDTLEELAHEIVKLHKPLQFNWSAKFGLPEMDDRSVANTIDRQQKLPFRAKVIAPDKQQKEVDLDAEDRQAAIASLRGQGFLILELIEKSTNSTYSHAIEQKPKIDNNTAIYAEQPIPSGHVEPETEGEKASKPKQKLICYSCGEPITYKVAKFCWFNKSRFGGNIYCLDCQKSV